MEQIAVPLQKRTSKFTLYTIAGSIMAVILAFSTAKLIADGFSGSTAFFSGLLAFGLVAVGMALHDHYKQWHPELVVESDGTSIRFFIRHSMGTSNSSDSIKIGKMKRFYVVEKKTRYLIADRLFAFEPKSGIANTNIDVFPSLAEIDEAGIAKVMDFVGKKAPDMALGYSGPSFVGIFK